MRIKCKTSSLVHRKEWKPSWPGEDAGQIRAGTHLAIVGAHVGVGVEGGQMVDKEDDGICLLHPVWDSWEETT